MTSPQNGTLRAGVAKSDITTDAPVAMIRDPLYAKALVLDDGRTHAAMIAMDTTTIFLGDQDNRIVRCQTKREASENKQA